MDRQELIESFDEVCGTVGGICDHGIFIVETHCQVCADKAGEELNEILTSVIAKCSSL